MFSTILTFLIVLGLLVFVHELGHFLLAKKAKMQVDEFGFGFPPRAVGVKKGGTIYSLNWIPLGGFVKIKGESGEYRLDPDSFASKSIPRRLIVLAAGIVMNLFLASILLSIGLAVGLPSVINGERPAGATVTEEAIRIARVLPGSPTQEAGLLVGEELLSVDGRVFATENEARSYILTKGMDGLTFLVKREDGTTYEKTLFARELPDYGITGVGIGLMKTGIVSYPVHLAVYHGVIATAVYTYEVIRSLIDLLVNLVVHQQVSMDLSGPVGIAVMTGEVAKLGIVYLIQFAAVLSINLAVINGLPFPALDGGRILFLLVEAIRRKPIPQRAEAFAHNAGFVLLMMLVVLVTYRDLVRYGGAIVGAITGK